jgi:organic hydroperoxide reductase OsmC/OhrA
MPTPFPHRYDVRFEAWGPEGWLTSGIRPPIEGGAPLEFDGRGDVWSPEHLLLSSLALCHFTTFRALARKARLAVIRYKGKADGELSKTAEGLAFTKLELDVVVQVRPGDAGRAEELLGAAKKHCLVANTLRVPVLLQARAEAATQDEEVPVGGR